MTAPGRVDGPGEQLALFEEPGAASEAESGPRRGEMLAMDWGLGLSEGDTQVGAVDGDLRHRRGCHPAEEAPADGAPSGGLALKSHPQHGHYDQDQHDRGRRGRSEIATLFEIAGQEGETIAQLTGSLEQLRSVQAAKEALARLTPTEVRAALRHRHLTLVPAHREVATAAPETKPDWRGSGDGGRQASSGQGAGPGSRRGTNAGPGAPVSSPGLEGA